MWRLQQVKLLTAIALLALSSLVLAEHGYPRTLAIAIGIPVQYDNPELQKSFSKADIVVLGFWPHWKENENKSMRNVVQAIKRLNPNALVGQYTILNEAKGSENRDKTSRDISQKIDHEKWWLKGPAGGRVQHTSKYGAWDVNITRFTKPDDDNKRYPEWLAERNYRLFFQKIPELDFWFLDNSLPQSPVAIADWDNNGIPQLSSLQSYAKSYREGHAAYWNAIRTLQPATLLIGNAPDLSSDEYRGQLNGALLEAAMGLSWSIYERQGWEALRARYYKLVQDTRPPKLVGFNVHGGASDYQKMRFGLTTCLLNDGYYSYTDIDAGYVNMLWFDEFDADLGRPIEQPPSQPWKEGIYKRQFENGLVLVNPSKKRVEVQLQGTYKKILGMQDSITNSGRVVSVVSLKPNDGIILLSNLAPPSSPGPINVTR